MNARRSATAVRADAGAARWPNEQLHAGFRQFASLDNEALGNKSGRAKSLAHDADPPSESASHDPELHQN
jgi:hypothetical protein